MDKLLRAQVMSEVRNALQTVMEGYNEQYLSETELLKQFQMFSAGWLKRYGYLLPRSRAIVTGQNGTEHSRWAYPKNKIARMVAEGDIEKLQARV